MPGPASSLEKLVRDALELVESQHGTSQSTPLPLDFVARTSEELGSEPLDRPGSAVFRCLNKMRAGEDGPAGRPGVDMG